MTAAVPESKPEADELWGYRAGQTVRILKAAGSTGVLGGTWKLRRVDLDATGQPVSITVWGGPAGHEQIRTFPLDRLEPPKGRRR